MEPKATNKAAVRFEAVSKLFQGALAVADLDFAIHQGEFFSLLGPSGCGKTTTLRLIAGFELPSKGRVLIDGDDVSGVPPYQRNVNTVFQSYALFPHLNVFENIAFGLRRKKYPADQIGREVAEALELVHMTEFEKRDVSRLSGGQQQRVALARALVNRPKVLLLDEPMAALDSKLKKNMQRELKALQKHLGITFILVTHDQEEALTLSDRIAVLLGGKLQQISSPRTLYHQPENRFVAEFIGSANFLPLAVSNKQAHYRDHVLRSAEMEPDGPHLWMLRPESITVSKKPMESMAQVRGKLLASVFTGAVTRHRFELTDGTEFVAEELNRDQGPLTVGDNLYLNWSREAGRLLPVNGSS